MLRYRGQVLRCRERDQLLKVCCSVCASSAYPFIFASIRHCVKSIRIKRLPRLPCFRVGSLARVLNIISSSLLFDSSCCSSPSFFDFILCHLFFLVSFPISLICYSWTSASPLCRLAFVCQYIPYALIYKLFEGSI